jgi:regulation of enolase protein 1 (concanavalin A-like superfamily)/Zn-dependent protease with chaperone function
VATIGIVTSLILRRWLRTSAGLLLQLTMLSVIFLTLCAFCSWPSWLELVPRSAVPVSQFATVSGTSSQLQSGATPDVTGIDPVENQPVRSAVWNHWWGGSRDLTSQHHHLTLADEFNQWIRTGGLVCGLFVSAAFAVGLFRFVGGFWGIRVFISGSRPLTVPLLRRQVELLRVELGCPRTVRLRETSKLALAATVGWRHPVVLLSENWKTWTDAQLRSVLAHEIAHVAQGDFLASVAAQLGLLLHYYHPFVHWLVNRLRLEQELAADAMAARVIGDSQTYLRAIGELALNQRSEPVGWAVHAFLPTQRTFLRRIEMLRDPKNMARRASLNGRWGTTICVAVVTLLAAGFRPAEVDPIPPGFRDDFIETYNDAWTVLNENSENVSLTKTRGMLTITTEPGGIWRSYNNAKNIFLIDTPMKYGNFVMTTRIVGFDPQARYQQAGLICFNDIDNYVKFGLEFDPGNGGKTLAVVPETDGIDHENAVLQVNDVVDDLWLRIIRYDEKYIFASSRDGKNYKTVVIQKCDVDFPSKVGILAKNGNRNDAPGIDACFDLFEIVPLETRPELERLIKREMEF